MKPSTLNPTACIPFLVLVLSLCILQYLDTISQKEAPSDLHHGSYRLTPLNDGTQAMGATIAGVDLCRLHLFDQSALNTFITRLKQDLYRYEFLILKKQCMMNEFKIPPLILSEFASQFGLISNYGSKYPNPSDPNVNISALSNDEKRGKMVVGSEGWHVDGTAEIMLNPIVFQHIIAVPNEGYGGTDIISSKRLIDYIKNTNMTLYNLLNRLYVSKAIKQFVHPVIAVHPITGQEIMVIHTAFSPIIYEVVNETMLFRFNEQFVRKSTVLQESRKSRRYRTKWLRKQHKDESDRRLIRWPIERARALMQSLEALIENECRERGLVYTIYYEKGDLLIRDNPPLLHRGPVADDIQLDKAGLRVMWRLTLDGTSLTSKF